MEIDRSSPATSPTLMDCPSGRSRRPSKTTYRVVVMGSSRVGKTALINQFLYDSFVDQHKPTIEELHRGEYDDVVLDILDTSGTYSFPAMRTLSIEKADGFVLVYAVDDADSFEEVRTLREQILRERHPETTTPLPIVVVANKNDLDDGHSPSASASAPLQCPFARETAETTVCIDWEHGFVESSAKHNCNVELVFRELLSRVDQVNLRSIDLSRRSSCPPNFQRRHSGGSNVMKKHLLKRRSCNIS